MSYESPNNGKDSELLQNYDDVHAFAIEFNKYSLSRKIIKNNLHKYESPITNDYTKTNELVGMNDLIPMEK
ncbi:hypothetical protein BCR32DRAFT_286366 [Anaeromyces robustus]|uniref:Uncharacterized protein n=1 Tax=Anaeromyces robustus TaxID=1754192 RepID=A0A1Y1VZ26_9FUNG|nr:hypothetical protein BCR32DRAFT_286366 [Anaeromyces robustus]|eukprot:ORX66094.1 hypothetical protein BCR32DRAFT_286366 [Anaeromyces robustus]